MWPTVQLYMWRKRRISIVCIVLVAFPHIPSTFDMLEPFWSREERAQRYSSPLPLRIIVTCSPTLKLVYGPIVRTNIQSSYIFLFGVQIALSLIQVAQAI